MSAFKGHLKGRIALHDRRERKKSVSKDFCCTRALGHLAAGAKPPDVAALPHALCSSDTKSIPIWGGEFPFECGLPFSSFEDIQQGTNSILSPDDINATLSSNDYEWESGVLHKRRRGYFLNTKKHSRSELSLCHLPPLEPQWKVELCIYTVYAINTSIVHDGTHTCIKIKQNGLTLGRTSVKPSSSQQVWEQTFSIPLLEVQHPLTLKFCSRKAGRFSTLGMAQLPLNECLVDIIYSKHLELMGIEGKYLIGTLRMQVCLRSSRNSSPLLRKKSSTDDIHRTHKSRLHLKQRSLPALNLTDISSFKHGPLNAGVQTFEARYLGLLNLYVVSRPSNVYARRWTPLQHQPTEVAVITNPLTKATEIVSPRLPWPPHFLRGASALQFNPVTGPQVALFDSAVLHLNILSACGLQSIPLSKFLNRFRTNEADVDSVHRGVMVAKYISYSQAAIKQTQALSTQVQLQFGKDKYATQIRKSTYNPVWNQTFTFHLTRSSNTLIEIQLTSIANPNISGPASGIEKIGEALIDISRLPMDFTQRIEIELNGYRPKPRLLLLATLTGLAKDDPPYLLYHMPSIIVTSSFDSYGHPSDAESATGSVQSIRSNMSRRNVNSCSNSVSPEAGDLFSSLQGSKENSSLDETDAQIAEHYSWSMALKNRFDVGFLRVNVIAASGLAAKEMNGKCDPYCLLELINMHVQTHTVKKTLNPVWKKIFVFPVTDIHSVLYITVKDDEKSKPEFLGRVAIPLMKVRNHERSWYALKNADLTERSRGSILLEFFFVYNHFKAAWRTLNPTEAWLNHPVRPRKYKKLSVEYKTAIQDNVMRLKTIFKPMAMISQMVDDICSWENPWHTLTALVVYNAVVWNFQPYMVPLGMIVGILASRKTSKNPHLPDILSSARAAAGVGASALGPVENHEKYLRVQSSQHNEDGSVVASPKSSFECDSDVLINNALLYSLEQETLVEDKQQEFEKHTAEPKEPKQGKKKFNAIMDIIGGLPQKMDLIASAIEKTIGIFEWQVPWLTWFCLIFLVIFTLILYFVPLRVVLCIIGTNQLTRKLLRPNSKYTFSTFNVISRVPSRPEAEQQRRLTPRSFVYTR
ncbi:multiple C2 and transmembrane domain containing protein [Echinococcus multilocularis]|uniref:Multiple C2 and transmembrane domain containing protein n=1 Tax=Echinococcus multilocularis TaxID=6211 RepID=A0A068YG49_ECHMU|nr:multiple C2 and transmembrane domain containing protein [Echinococcus multilocularis]